MSRPDMRKRVVVDNLQFRLVLYHAFYTLVIVIVLLLAAFGPLIIQMWDESLSWEKQVAISDQFLGLHSRIWLPVLVTLGFVAAHSIRVSHRIAGPLYRFRQVLRSISEGDLSMQVKIRPRDYLDKEADEFNRMIGGVRERLERIRDGQCKTQALIGRLEHEIDEGNRHEALAALSILSERLEQTGDSIAEFDLSGGLRPVLRREPGVDSVASEAESECATLSTH